MQLISGRLFLHMSLRPRFLFQSVAVAHLVAWVLISWLSIPALDSYGDMVENYAWSQTLAWGTFKHPPLVAWMVGAWFAVFPTEAWPYYLLSYLNAGVGLVGIVCLARLWLPDDMPANRRDVFELTAWLFAALSFPYSNLAAKFNTDTVLLSVWPWTAYAFFAALRAVGTRRRWLFTVLLGVMAAAAMLGKYYSALLLASLVVVSFSHGDYRRWYRTKYPYVAVAVFLLLMLPHVLWEIRMDFPFRQYLESKIDANVDPGRIAVFLLSGIYYLPASWLAWYVLRQRFSVERKQPVVWTFPLRGLVLLCCLPSIITASFNLFARVHLTTHWAIPAWFALPVLLAVWLLPDIGEQFAWQRFERGLAVLGVALLAGGLLYTLTLSIIGDPKYSLARQEMVRTIETRFLARFPGQELSWAGGSWPESGALAFFSTSHPRALPGFPDERRAMVNAYPAWQARYGVIICYASDTYAREGSHDTECENQTRGWLHSHQLPLAEETLNYHAEGWRYIRAQPKNVTVFWIQPAREKL
jgi:4-amino-4-deoxy-L-arabinose transferase-like glycosyltransferase